MDCLFKITRASRGKFRAACHQVMTVTSDVEAKAIMVLSDDHGRKFMASPAL